MKAKGGGSQGDRLRPTAYIRRRKRHVNEDEEHLNGKIVNDCLRDKHTTILCLSCHSLPQQVQLNLTTPLQVVSEDEEHPSYSFFGHETPIFNSPQS